MVLRIKNYAFILDNEQYKIAKDLDWKISKSKNSLNPYVIVDGHKKSMSKIIFNLADGINVFHKNGNIFDYRKESLYFCNASQFAYLISNTKKRSTSSKYYGVSFKKSHNKWTTTINCNSLYISLTFPNEKDAAIAADYLARVNYGKVSMLNFPEYSFDQIKDAFNALNNKYGFTREEKITRSQQGVPKKTKCKKHSTYVGVTKDKKSWRAYINYNRKRIFIGRFRDEVSAAKAYNEKAKALYGEYAKLNIIE